MGFKIKKSSIFGISAKREKIKLMTRIAEMLDDKEFVEALPLLQEAVRKYPNEERFWDMYGYVGSELKLTTVMQKAFAKLAQFQPNDPDIWHNLAMVYAMDFYPSLAMRNFREFARRFPFDSRKESALKTAAVMEEEIKSLLEAYGLAADEEGFKIAALHDKVQLFMHQNEYEKSIETARELIKKAPDFIAPYNNLSLIYFMSGNIEKALDTAQLALEKQPENYHALGNAARFLAFLGRNDEARDLAGRLRVVERKVPDIYDKKIETFAYLGDDASLVEVYLEAEKKKIPFKQEELIKNLAAFSFYQLGDEKKARKLWKEAAKEDSQEAEENLKELNLPFYERNNFALTLPYWLPSAYTNELLNLTKDIKDDDDYDVSLKRKTNDFIDKHPHLIAVFPMILERSSLSAKEFVLRLADWSENPEMLEILKKFAFGQKGSDKIRNQAALVLSKLKAIPKNRQMWIRGEWTEIHFTDFYITGEPLFEKLYPMKPEAKEFLAKGIEAILSEKILLAEQYYQKALEIEPEHPVLLNNLLMVREKKGEKFEMKKEVEELHRRFPDYLFPAVTLARLELRDGNLEKAKEIAKKFVDRKEWHIGEFKHWSNLQIEICLVEKQFEGARSWLSQMRQADENLDFEDFDETEYRETETRIELAELLEKLPSGFEKLMNRGKRKQKQKRAAK